MTVRPSYLPFILSLLEASISIYIKMIWGRCFVDGTVRYEVYDTIPA